MDKKVVSTMAQLRNKNLIVGFALVGFGLLGDLYLNYTNGERG